MPASLVTLEQYQVLLTAYRDHPGRHARAAQAANITAQTAKKYWEKGNPDAPDLRARPICELLHEEQVASRARLNELQARSDTLSAELDAKRRAENSVKAMADATDTRVAEGQIIRMSRGAATALMVTLTKLNKSAARLGDRVAKNIDRVSQESADMTRAEILDSVRMVNTLAATLARANEAARSAMEMERLLLGEPTAVVQHNHLVEVSIDEAERRMAAGQRAIERARAKGLIVEGHVVAGPGSLPQHLSHTLPATQVAPTPITSHGGPFTAIVGPSSPGPTDTH